MRGNLAIPDWPAFIKSCDLCFAQASLDLSGSVATYIPVLAKQDPNKFGVSVCTIDGQRYNQGDCTELFGVQSCMKPINYAIALETRGFDKVFTHMGIEPSGHAFNEMVLDRRRVEDGRALAQPCGRSLVGTALGEALWARWPLLGGTMARLPALPASQHAIIWQREGQREPGIDERAGPARPCVRHCPKWVPLLLSNRPGTGEWIRTASETWRKYRYPKRSRCRRRA